MSQSLSTSANRTRGSGFSPSELYKNLSTVVLTLLLWLVELSLCDPFGEEKDEYIKNFESRLTDKEQRSGHILLLLSFLTLRNKSSSQVSLLSAALLKSCFLWTRADATVQVSLPTLNSYWISHLIANIWLKFYLSLNINPWTSQKVRCSSQSFQK